MFWGTPPPKARDTPLYAVVRRCTPLYAVVRCSVRWDPTGGIHPQPPRWSTSSHSMLRWFFGVPVVQHAQVCIARCRQALQMALHSNSHVGKPYMWVVAETARSCPLEEQCRCHVAHPQNSLAHSCARDVAHTYNITTHHHKYVVTCSSLWASPAACTEMPSARGRQALPVALHTHAPASRPDMQHPYKLESGRQA